MEAGFAPSGKRQPTKRPAKRGLRSGTPLPDGPTLFVIGGEGHAVKIIGAL